MVRSEAFRAVDAVSRLLHRQVVASGADLGRGRGSFLEAVVQSLFPYQPRELLDHLARAGVLDGQGLFHKAVLEWLEERGLMGKTVRDLVREALFQGHVVTDYVSALALDEDDWQLELRGFGEEGVLRPLAPGEKVDRPWGAAVPGDIARYAPAAVVEGERGPLYVLWVFERGETP